MPTRVTSELAHANLACLRQARELLGRLGDEDYRAAAPGGRGGVGAHLRHVLDHCDCLVDGVAPGVVDYDSRERDVEVESSRARALERIERAESRLAALRSADATRELRVLVDSGERGRRSEARTSLARELQFLVSHTVHHFALIALLLRARGVEPGADFGVAPSTLKFEQGSGACAR